MSKGSGKEFGEYLDHHVYSYYIRLHVYRGDVFVLGSLGRSVPGRAKAMLSVDDVGYVGT